MSVYAQLLQQILTLQQDAGDILHLQQLQHSELRRYTINGDEPLSSHQNSALIEQLVEGSVDQLFVIEWCTTNSATMIESGLHLFLDPHQARQWRDCHPNPLFHSLAIKPLSIGRARHELTLLSQSNSALRPNS
ncbi:hypothetical protein [Motiliproteus sp.]|uniref:hypothetical protein n=1 Tax=Motiliproteus sp. TaxID=1898955 RepID=UPI003BA9A8AF